MLCNGVSDGAGAQDGAVAEGGDPLCNQVCSVIRMYLRNDDILKITTKFRVAGMYAGMETQIIKNVCGVYLEQYGMRVQGRLTELSQEIATPYAKRETHSVSGLRKSCSTLEQTLYDCLELQYKLDLAKLETRPDPPPETAAR